MPLSPRAPSGARPAPAAMLGRQAPLGRGLPAARGPRAQLPRRKALQAGGGARVPVSGRAQVAATPARRAAAPVGSGGAGPAARGGGEREAAGCGRPGIPSSSSNASRAGCAAVAASQRPASRRLEKGEGPAGVRLGRPAAFSPRRPARVRPDQVSSRRGLAASATDPGRAALGLGGHPPAPRLAEAPALLPPSGCRARSLEVEEKLLPSPGPSGRRAGGRVCLLGSLPACPVPRSPPCPGLPDPAGVRVVVQPLWSRRRCTLRPKGRGVTRESGRPGGRGAAPRRPSGWRSVSPDARSDCPERGVERGEASGGAAGRLYSV